MTKTTKQFSDLAQYYDLFYRDKDYPAEALFAHKKLLDSGSNVGRLLELGCGTGRHAMAFADLGWAVTGVDISPSMVRQASKRANQKEWLARAKPDFKVADIAKLRLDGKYDSVISLFHVMGYQTRNEDIMASLLTVSNHLTPGGLFLFDFWFGPAVLSEPPTIRIKEFKNRSVALTRISRPTIDVVRNTVAVEFELFVKRDRNRSYQRLVEKHCVRYFFIPELEQLLQLQGFKLLAHGQWLTDSPLSSKSWYGWVVAQRI